MKLILLYYVLFIFYSCGTISLEFSSAKTYARIDQNLEKAEEFALVALNDSLFLDDATIPYFLATEVYRPQKQYNKMINMFDEALRRNPDQPLEKVVYRDDEVLETISDGITFYRLNIWRTIYNNAIELYKNNEIDLAKEQMLLALEIYPQGVENYVVLGNIYLYSTTPPNYKEAENLANKGLTILPESSQIYKILGEVSYGLSDYEKAKFYYTKALNNINDSDPYLMRVLINVYIKLNEVDEAVNLANSLFATNPDDGLTMYNVGVMYHQMTKSSYDKAWEALKRNEKSVAINYFKSALTNGSEAKQYLRQASFADIQEDLAKDANMMIKELNNFLRNIKAKLEELS